MAEAGEKPEAKDKAESPSSGIFGFAGSTLFQPGQSQFNVKTATVPFKPETKDESKPDRA